MTSLPMAGRLQAMLAAAAGKRVVVLGDLLADEYVTGRIARVSREAPVFIVEHESTQVVPGGAGNAAANVAALGGDAVLVALAGRDDAGRRVLTAAQRHMDTSGVVRPAGYHTPVKTRILASEGQMPRQQVLRVDRATQQPVADRWRDAWLRHAIRAVADADAILLSDYGCGVLTPAIVAEVLAPLRKRRPSVPVLLDSRYDVLKYRGLTACTPNLSEVEAALDVTIGDDLNALEQAGRALLTRTAMQAVLVTRGSRGMALFEAGRPTLHIAIHGSDTATDVTGAGDTVMATLTMALAAGASMADAAQLANVAGGLVVLKRGTATVSARELSRAVRAVSAKH